MKHLLITAIFCAFLSLQAFPAGKVIQETIEAAAKVSGKTLSHGARHSAAAALSKAMAKYGDDAVRITRQGGLEVLKQSAEYGDDFWRIVRNAEPAAIRSLALHADKMLPVAKRIGPAFLKLEAKAPGLALKAVNCFGDDSAKILAKLPADDVSRLIGLAKRAETPAVKGMLLKRYLSVPDKEKFFKALDWKRTAAIGLSAAAIVGAYKLGCGVEGGLTALAKSNPEAFTTVIADGIAPFKWLIFALLLLALWPAVKWLWKRSGITFPKFGTAKKTAPEQDDSARPAAE